MVKKTWGPDAKRLKTDPAYTAVRHHQSEFGACTKAAKLLRDCLMPVIEGSLDNRLSPRLNKLMHTVKNLDARSKPGKRRVSQGFELEEGRQLLKGFQFNIHCSLEQLLRRPYTLARKQQEIRLVGLQPKRHLRFPKGATHAVLQIGLAQLDFDGKRTVFKEDSLVLPLTGAIGDHRVSVKTKDLQKGLKVLVLKLAFLQEVAGEQLPLHNLRYTAAAVVDVWL